jgi:hypothetical protein
MSRLRRLWLRARRRRAVVRAVGHSHDAEFDAKWAELDGRTSQVVRDLAEVLEQRAQLHDRESRLPPSDQSHYEGRRRNGGPRPTST